MTSIVLASGSPRRKELLSLLGVPFKVVSPAVVEMALPHENPSQQAVRLARMKAEAVASEEPAKIIVAADTLVVLSGQVMGKPADESKAWAMLEALRGREHQVISGIGVVAPSSRVIAVRSTETRVWMRDYGDDEIADYIARGEPFDKAGAYAIQDAAFNPVARIEGCYTNVMGLPLCHLYVTHLETGFTLAVSPVQACEAHTRRKCLVASQILEQASH
jgi:MAF protein